MTTLSKTALAQEQGPKWGFYLLVAGLILAIGCYVYCSNRAEPTVDESPTVLIEPVPDDVVVPPPDPNAYPSNTDSLPTPVDPPPPTP